MEKEKTAVEWLAEQLTFKNEFGCYISDNTDNVTDIVNKAKQIEKEQIELAFFEGKNDGAFMERYSDYKHITANEYYNETYGKR